MNRASKRHPENKVEPNDSGIGLLGLTWPEFFERVKTAEPPEILQTRLKVIRTLQDLFSCVTHFCDLDLSDRSRIAGAKTPKLDYGWFGGPGSSGTFRSVINKNDPSVSAALDCVPLQGDITRLTYLQFVERFKQAFPRGGGGIGCATRLLTMKRPDVFVCISSKIGPALSEELRVPRFQDLNTYWGRIIEPIQKTEWWRSTRPAAGEERDVWEARAAFLDGLFRCR